MKLRGFEIITSYKEKSITLPQRATHHAAGYDFEAAEEIVVPSIWKAGVIDGVKALFAKETAKQLKPTLIPTGIKAYMGKTSICS